MVFFNGVQFRLLVHHSHPKAWEPVGLHKDSINYEVLFEMNGFHPTRTAYDNYRHGSIEGEQRLRHSEQRRCWSTFRIRSSEHYKYCYLNHQMDKSRQRHSRVHESDDESFVALSGPSAT